jgi:hypothetical protein
MIARNKNNDNNDKNETMNAFLARDAGQPDHNRERSRSRRQQAPQLCEVRKHRKPENVHKTNGKRPHGGDMDEPQLTRMSIDNTQAKFAILHQQLQDADKIIEHKSQAWSDCAFGFLVAALTSGYVSVAGRQSAQETRRWL